MSMETKYIGHEVQGFILWPRTGYDHVWHVNMADFIKEMCDGGGILSAGSVMWTEEGPVCYGGSESLNIYSEDGDTEALREQLGIQTVNT